MKNKSFVQRCLEKLRKKESSEVKVIDSYFAPVFRDEVQARLNQKIRGDCYV